MKIKETAFRRAKKSDCRFQLCAIIMEGNRIVSIGHNRKNLALKREGLTSIHAEHDALRKLHPEVDKTKCEMYVFRFNIHGVPRLAKPCERCQKKLARSNLKAIYYTQSTEGELNWAKL